MEWTPDNSNQDIEDRRDSSGGGSGLGLALIAELLRAQDSRLEFEPGHSLGTRAVVRIPVATAADSGART